MTKDLAMQGSCIAKSISIHSYPRDLNEMEFQERVESVGKKQEKKLGVERQLQNTMKYPTQHFQFICLSVLKFRGSFDPKTLNLNIFTFWGASELIRYHSQVCIWPLSQAKYPNSTLSKLWLFHLMSQFGSKSNISTQSLLMSLRIMSQSKSMQLDAM